QRIVRRQCEDRASLLNIRELASVISEGKALIDTIKILGSAISETRSLASSVRSQCNRRINTGALEGAKCWLERELLQQRWRRLFMWPLSLSVKKEPLWLIEWREALPLCKENCNLPLWTHSLSRSWHSSCSAMCRSCRP